jgi:peptide/nickel transport system substrate-binding protein
MAIPGDPPSLDGHVINPNAYDGLWQAFDRLTAYDAQLNPQPMLAESWDVSSDLKQFKLNLRHGVQWHSGRDFSSDDVKWNLLRVRDPKLQAGSAFGAQSNWFTTIDTPDKYTVLLTSDQPRPAVFDFFEYLNMLDQGTMEGPDAQTKVVGTGPFTFVEWVQGDHLTLAKNKNYWQPGLPYTDQLSVVIARDPQAAIARFEAGDLDAVQAPPLNDYNRLKSVATYHAFTNPLSGTNYLFGINVQQPPLDDKTVRQALNYAINRQRFVDTVMLDITEPRSLPWGNPNSLAYDASKLKYFEFDLDKARMLLTQANVSNFTMDILVSSADLVELSQIMHADLAQIGVTLNVRQLDLAAWAGLVNNRNYTGAYAAGGTYSQMEPLTQFTNSGAFNPNSNNSGFQDPTYSQLVATVAAEPDRDKRRQPYSQLNDFLLDQTFVAPISGAPARWLATAKLNGIGFTVHEACVWATAWFNA